ncbi:MAG TPA: UDP-glucose 4-epimerase GalE [Gammaproteobacteria bacterium]|nr:UDP-glucose 4-epimerase GalE [Gammaproteobacteria bacterium]
MKRLEGKNILIVGGAGYIGSHMSAFLSDMNYTPVVLDDLSTGHRDAVLNAEFIEGSIADSDLLDHLFQNYSFDAVMHFASFIQVGESVKFPEKYYQNNVANTLNLLSAMLKHKINKFIFSSTAAVYGEPQYTPIDENHPIKPINPYGHSKNMVEQMLADFMYAYGLQYAVLRYFNAAGADPKGRLSERHFPETHLIPIILEAANGQREAVTVYGEDYPTPDGTCIRDFIHVTDLCDAHFKALSCLDQGKNNCIYNLGTGQGYSVKQVIDAAREVTEREIPVIYGARREGDPAILVADARRAMRDLKWTPRYSDLKMIIQHAWVKRGSQW